MEAGSISIGELSRRTSCNIETIRYYERIGVLPLPRRRGRFRVYEANDATRLNFVRRARELGFTLDEIRALLKLAAGGRRTCAEVHDIGAKHLTDVRIRIADLKAMERALARAVLQCETRETADCPLITSLLSESSRTP